jgi:outer membrane protein with beta-barrel domain
MIRIHRLSIPFATALLSLAAVSPALAQDVETKASFELFGARVEPTDSDADFHTEAYGLRGGYRLNNSWTLEGSVARLDEDVDVWFGDVSAKVYAFQSDRFRLYALGGPGVYKVEDLDEKLTLHVGIGAEIGLGQRAYLRPEVRGRWLAEELRADDGLVDYSLGIGWRF